MRANCSCCGYPGSVTAVLIDRRREFICERCAFWYVAICDAHARLIRAVEEFRFNLAMDPLLAIGRCELSRNLGSDAYGEVYLRGLGKLGAP